MISPLPMTVIGGYLGAGKTTLINRLLAEPHGMRLTLLVNDFGAINVDAALLASVTEDTIELTNGCVCCTMGADLFMAIAAILDRPHHPDHLIVEASGIADPASIARAAIAEPDLSYGGIVTVVDGLHYPATSTDPLVAAQVQGQVRCADYVLVSKTTGLPPPLQTSLQGQTTAPISALSEVDAVAPIVIGGFEAPNGPCPQQATAISNRGACNLGKVLTETRCCKNYQPAQGGCTASKARCAAWVQDFPYRL